jgi:hypothetical protein
MADYKETTVTCNKWQRAFRIVIENPYNSEKTVTFSEEEAIDIEGEVVTRPVGTLRIAFNPTETFPGLDPNTNLEVGREVTHAEVYALLYSLYMHLANQRDAQLQG